MACAVVEIPYCWITLCHGQPPPEPAARMPEKPSVPSTLAATRGAYAAARAALRPSISGVGFGSGVFTPSCFVRLRSPVGELFSAGGAAGASARGDAAAAAGAAAARG